jgi:hypothetical protein
MFCVCVCVCVLKSAILSAEHNLYFIDIKPRFRTFTVIFKGKNLRLKYCSESLLIWSPYSLPQSGYINWYIQLVKYLFTLSVDYFFIFMFHYSDLLITKAVLDQYF